MKARIKNALNYKKPAFWVIIASMMAVIILAVVLISNPIKGFSIYQHPETFLSQNSLRAPAKVHIIDNMSGDEYMLTEPNEITQVTAIVEDLRIAKKEISKARSEKVDSRYSISYYEDIKDSISDYRYTIHVAPVWINNNVKPSYRFKLVNQKDITKRLEAVFASKDGKSAYDVDSLLKNKTSYIGDNSKVGALIDALPLPKGVTRDGIALSKDKAPYGVTIHYSLDDDSLEISEEQFLRNAVLLFALIDNAEEVTHIGHWNDKLLSSTLFRYTYTRADAERIVGGDVRQFGENQESLTELIEIIQMLSTTDNAETFINDDWWKSKYPVINNVKFHVLIDEYFDDNDINNPEVCFLVRKYWVFDGTVEEWNQVTPATNKIALPKSDQITTALDFKEQIKILQILNPSSISLKLPENTIVSDNILNQWQEENYDAESEYSKESPKDLTYQMLEDT